MVFWKRELAVLSASERNFRAIFQTMRDFYSDNIFAESVVDGMPVRMTYTQLYHAVDGFAASLRSRFAGREGEFIALRMENGTEWVTAFFGILKAGFKPVLINTRLDSASIDYVLEQTRSLCVICDEVNYRDGHLRFSELTASGSLDDSHWADEIALLTSGTTGMPKIIIYDGRAISAQILTTADIVGKSPYVANKLHNYDIRLVAFLPFYHIFGLMTVLLWFGFFGRTLIFLSGYDSESIRYACIYNKATHFFAVPLVWNTVAASIFAEAKKTNQLEKLNKAINFSNKLQSIFPAFGRFVAKKILFKDVRKRALGQSLYFCISGGGAIRPDTLRLLNGLGYSLHNGYGMTEAGICSVELSQKASKRIEGAVGMPFKTVSQVITDDGLLHIDGDTIYTAQIIDGKRVDRDKTASLCTNDMFEVLPDGRWKILGRRDDIIIGANGENLSPDNIEAQIHCPLPFCVIGLPDTDGEMQSTLIVEVGKNSTAFSRTTALKAVFDSMDALPITLRPARVMTTEDEIPSTLGKTRRAVLRSMIADGSFTATPAERPAPEDVQSSFDESTAIVCAEIKGLFASTLGIDEGSVTEFSNVIYDLGADSLSYYNIVAAVSNKYGVSLTMDSDHPLMTPAQFAARVLEEQNTVH